MPNTVVDDAAWLAARLDLLKREKELTRLRDELSAERRKLPWRLIDKDYRFDTVQGEQDLAALFGTCSQLLVYHFMYGPDADAGCPGCSWWADNYDPNVVHLAQRDIKLIAVARAPLAKLISYNDRMGWSFDWASSFQSDFNMDFHVSFSQQAIDAGKAFYNYTETGNIPSEAPGVSIFAKQDGNIYHTYSTFSRGLDMLNAGYHMMDLTPKGRDEGQLEYATAWLRRHDEYNQT